MIYILIILWFPAIDHIEFNTKEACEHAAAVTEARQSGHRLLIAYCVKKG
jgi:hypothetical protein